MVLEKIIDLICSELGFEPDIVNEGTPLEELLCDDLEAAELALAIEGEFDIELEQGVAYDGGETVLSLSDLVEDLIAGS